MSKEEYLGALINKAFHGWRNYYNDYKLGKVSTKEYTC